MLTIEPGTVTAAATPNIILIGETSRTTARRCGAPWGKVVRDGHGDEPDHLTLTVTT